MRDFRYIEKGHGRNSFSDHEFNELAEDFDINVDGFYVLAPLTKDEWNAIKYLQERKNHE